MSRAVDLREDGLLWLINRTVFHPRGFALSVHPDGKLYLEGDGSEPWVFKDEPGMKARENECFRRVSRLLAPAPPSGAPPYRPDRSVVATIEGRLDR